MNIQAKAGRYLYISVADSGIGMPKTIIHKIFEPFFTTKALNKGTGLGLSTVMAIVKSHNGVIDVYSDPGKGTTFTLYLPAMENPSEASPKSAREIAMPYGNGQTILVVDDESAILDITRHTLETYGYRVLSAQEGAEAVAIYAENKNDIAVVLTDMMMPIMDGANLVRALQRINPQIKIVAASGLSLDVGRHEHPGSSIRHFLTKPYTAEILINTIRQVLEET
jgi:CheY-like chemotaxis protein